MARNLICLLPLAILIFFTVFSCSKTPEDKPSSSVTANKTVKVIAPEKLKTLPPIELASWLEYSATNGNFDAKPEVRNLLETAPPGIKLRCMDYLIAAKDENALPVLRTLSEDDDPSIRLGALAARRELEDFQDISAWVKALSDSDPELPQEGAYGIAAAGRKDLAEKIAPLLQSPHRAVKVEAAFALVDLQWPKAPEVFGGWTHKNDYLLNEAGIRAWSLAAPKDALPVLLEVARRPDKELADLALHQIVSFGPDVAIPALESLANGTEDIKLWAIYFLRVFGTEEALKALKTFHKNATPAIEYFLDSDFSKIKNWDDPENWDYSIFLPKGKSGTLTINERVKLLESKNSFLRIQALSDLFANNINDIGTSRAALRHLVKASNDSSVAIRFRAAKIMTARTDFFDSSNYERLLADPVDRIRQRAMVALAKSQKADATGILTSFLRSQSVDLMSTALFSMALANRPDCSPALVDASTDADFSIRAAAMYGLGICRARGDSEKRTLANGLKDDSAWVRMAAAYSMQSPDYCEPLAKAIFDKSYYVRTIVAGSLAKHCPSRFEHLMAKNENIRNQWEPAVSGIESNKGSAEKEIEYFRKRYYEIDLTTTYDHIREYVVLEAGNLVENFNIHE